MAYFGPNAFMLDAQSLVKSTLGVIIAVCCGLKNVYASSNIKTNNKHNALT
jgi:hypothetical protein